MSVEREMSLAEWCAKLPSQHLVNQELSTLNTQLAALAEQNAKMREALQELSELLPVGVGIAALSLPDLTTPVLNRIRAEGMRMAAQFIEDKYDFLGEEITVADEIRARADELEQSK